MNTTTQSPRGLAPAFDPSVTFAAASDGCDGEYIYGRTCHPTGDACAEQVAKLEGAECCLLTNSGMAAISTVLLAMLKSGDHVVAPNVMYQPTRWMLSEMLNKLGIEVTFVDARESSAYRDAAKPNTRLAWIETPANPTLDLTDMRQVCEWARRKGITTAADNTFSTPLASRPLEHGVDVVIHSATKYLAGHGDLLAGAILTSVKTKNKILPWLDHLGSALHAHGAWMLQRGLATFELRFQRHQASALWLAEMLQTMSGVGQVYYPGLKSHPQRELFQRQMTGGGGVVSFELDGDQECVQRFLCRLERIAIARSLGEPKTLVAHPWSMHYRALTDQEKIAAGISPSLIRLAVGLEDRHEILDDIQQALCR